VLLALIKHYPEFGGADIVLEYQVMRQVKVSLPSFPLFPNTRCICLSSSYSIMQFA